MEFKSKGTVKGDVDKEKRRLSLSPSAQAVINSYLKMKIGNKIIACPYFINRQGAKAALRVFLGKASSQEIKEEIEMIAQQKEIDLNQMSEEEIYQLLKSKRLGIDCSGLVVHILKAEYQERKNINILRRIYITAPWKNPWRYFISRFRPIENISVRVLAHPYNSRIVKNPEKIQAGDLIIYQSLKHVLLIEEIKLNQEKTIKEIKIIHAQRMSPEEEGARVKRITYSFSELKKKIEQGEIILRRLKF
ncbi:hypothetical protein K9K85_02620 [Patescibacteria group bacterium]|nr:hypothetical protein [Patescibacteria group bacterium]